MSSTRGLSRTRSFVVPAICFGIVALAVAWKLRSDAPAGAVDPSDPEKIVARVRIVDFPEELVLYESVFWEPDDTASLRDLIRAAKIAQDKSVLEIGTGSGLVSLCCAKYGAERVVATDINPNAYANAFHNAKRLDVDDRMEVRLVSKNDPGAYAVLKTDEKFDLIISNPPWEDRPTTTNYYYALNDQNFALMQSLLSGLKQRLKPGGRAFLAYGCVSAIKELQRLAPRYGLQTSVYDDRNLNELDEVFLPGMLVILTPVR